MIKAVGRLIVDGEDILAHFDTGGVCHGTGHENIYYVLAVLSNKPKPELQGWVRT